MVFIRLILVISARYFKQRENSFTTYNFIFYKQPVYKQLALGK